MRTQYIYNKEMDFSSLSEMITKYALYDLFISLYEKDIYNRWSKEIGCSSIEDFLKENIEIVCRELSDDYGEYETIEWLCREMLDAGESFEVVESEGNFLYMVTYYKTIPTTKEDCLVVGVQLLKSMQDFNVTIDDIKKEYLKQELLKGGKDE